MYRLLAVHFHSVKWASPVRSIRRTILEKANEHRRILGIILISPAVGNCEESLAAYVLYDSNLKCLK